MSTSVPSNTSVQMQTSEAFNNDQPLPTLPSKSKKRAIIPAPPSSSDKGNHLISPMSPRELEFRQGVVLVVEDIVVNRKLFVRSLQKGGFTVEQAENGAIALKMMLEKDYRTVFMDVDMPVMCGDEALRQYWKQSVLVKKTPIKHPKIVMLTGNISDADREMALACGAHEFLTKPVVPQQLWDAASWITPPQTQ
mmetsp:Transcript_4037/g.5130  ORF Transcript_4037/g.5130 Transcript_4037/m.5130 type:complete len:194 (-) Transcript_4037:76-657(-)